MKRIGVIGLGKMGLSHLAILNTLTDVKVIAIADSSYFVTRALEKYTGIKAYSDYSRMLDKERLDAVVICLPSNLHYVACMDSIDHGLSFFVEKPFTLNPIQSEEILNKAKIKKVKGMVGYVNRYVRLFQVIKNLLDNKVIGEVYDYKCSMLGSVVHNGSKSSWRNSVEEGGGCLYDYGSHCIDLALYFFGEIESVLFSDLQALFSEYCEDVVRAVIRHSTGLIGSLYINWCDGSQRKAYNEIEISGSKGKIIANKQDLRVFMTNASEEFNLGSGWNIKYTTNYVEGVPFYLRGEEFTKEILDFIGMLDSNKTYIESGSGIENAYLTDRAIAMIREKALAHG